jgi:hypothetical protein
MFKFLRKIVCDVTEANCWVNTYPHANAAFFSPVVWDNERFLITKRENDSLFRIFLSFEKLRRIFQISRVGLLDTVNGNGKTAVFRI